ELGDAFGGEVGGGGRGGALALGGRDVHPEADGAGARLLEGFDLAEANLGGELVAFVEDGFGVSGAGLDSSADDVRGELEEVGGGEGFSGQSVSLGGTPRWG